MKKCCSHVWTEYILNTSLLINQSYQYSKWLKNEKKILVMNYAQKFELQTFPEYIYIDKPTIKCV